MQTVATFINSSFTFAFGWTLVHSLWQCALIAVALKLTFMAVGPAHARLRCTAALVALALCGLASALTFARYYDAGEQALAQLAGGGISQLALPGGSHWAAPIVLWINHSLAGLLAFWGLGFAWFSLRYAGDYRRAARLAREAVEPVPSPWRARFEDLARGLRLPANVAIRLSRGVHGACVVGHFKPVILLPMSLLTQLTRAEVEALILHEMAHIKRRDFLLNAMECCARAVYFFNPAVHWICRQADREREHACDDLAVSRCGDRHLYASSLAKAAQLQLHSRALLAASAPRYALLPRITRLWSAAERAPSSRLPMAAGLGALLLSMGVNVTALDMPSAATGHGPAAVSAAPLAPATPPAPTTGEAGPVAAPPAPAAPASERWETPPTPPAAPAPAKAPAPRAALPSAPALALDYARAEAPAPANRSARQHAPQPAPQQPPATGAPQLEPISSPDFNEVLISSAVHLPATRKIHIDDVTTEYSTRWLERYQSRTSNGLRNALLKDYGKALRRQLKESLEGAGWDVVAKPQADALRLQPRLFDVFILEPDPVGNKQTLVAQTGQAGIELTFTNAARQPFLKITDHRNTRTSKHEPILASRASNFHYINLLLGDWSKASVTYLDSVMNVVEQQSRAS